MCAGMVVNPKKWDILGRRNARLFDAEKEKASERERERAGFVCPLKAFPHTQITESAEAIGIPTMKNENPRNFKLCWALAD